ncbi:MAG: carbohydrate porin [Bryobacteraceae bacterium]
MAARWLQSNGIQLAVTQNLEMAEGDASPRKAPLVHSLTDFDLSWQPNSKGGLKGTKFAARYSLLNRTRECLEPDMQGFSSLSAPSFRHWREAWVEQPLWGKVRLKVGKVDANTEFAVIEFAGDMSNASLGVSPALWTMPTYPGGAASANVFADVKPWLSGGAGVYRMAEGGTYAVTEIRTRWAGRKSGRAAYGHWSTTSSRGGPTAIAGTSGSYFIVEQSVLRMGDDRGLRLFARFATADALLAPASTHSAYGFTWLGVGRRAKDSIGFAVLGLQPVGDGEALRVERIYELYYRIPLSKYFAIKADIQHVVRPAGVVSAPTVTIASVRLLMNLATPPPER